MSDLSTVEATQVLAEIRSLAEQLRDLRAELRSAVGQAAPALRPSPSVGRDARKVIGINAAARRYGKDKARLRAMFHAGLISGREIPGRGPTGKELSLSVASLDRVFGAVTA